MSLLAARGLRHEYLGGIRALDGVDLELRERELVVVIGPNGAGKSTLLKVLAGLVRPRAGTVELGGRALGRLAPRERARELAVVPQYLERLVDVTVREFVFGARYAHLGRWRRAAPGDAAAVRAGLAAADALDLADRLLAELSGGQRQRVLVARALAQESRVLLIDEPTSSLDPEHQVRVFELVAGLGAAGRAAIVVTHDLNLASQFATRLVLLADGCVAASGPVERVLAPEVLGPVYGDYLHYGRWPAGSGAAGRPFVLPRPPPSPARS